MNAADILMYGHRTVLKTLNNLPDSAWDTPDVCGWWSTRDIIAHLASFETILSEVFGTFLGGQPGPVMARYGSDPQNFNDVEVAARQHFSPTQTLAEYQANYEHNQDLLAQIPVERLSQTGTILWYGPEYSLDDFLVYTFYGHKREHTAQINVFRDQAGL